MGTVFRLLSCNFWMSTRNASLSALTMEDPSSCSRSVGHCVNMPLYSWERTPRSGKPSEDTWKTTPALRSFSPTSRETLASSSPSWTWLKYVTSSLRTVCEPARAGALAPCPVFIEPMNTGLGPEKTSFFQALSIPTKISEGTIEIITTVNVIKEGEHVDASAATLLNMLNISPFTYGLIVQQVYDSGTVFAPQILDIKPEDLRERFMEGVRNIACLSLSIGYPTLASAPHSLVNGFKNLLALAAVTDIEFKEAATIKEFLADPEKFAAAAAAAAAPASSDAPAAAAAAAPAKEESEEEEDDDMGFGLFD